MANSVSANRMSPSECAPDSSRISLGSSHEARTEQLQSRSSSHSANILPKDASNAIKETATDLVPTAHHGQTKTAQGDLNPSNNEASNRSFSNTISHRFRGFRSWGVQRFKKPSRNGKALQKRSILIALPAELRVAIYRFALIEEEPLWISKVHYPRQPALTLVSRQIRKETIPIFYGENRFKLYVEDLDFSGIQAYFERIGPRNRYLLTSTGGLEAALFGNQRHWGNWMMWAKNCYSRQCPGLVARGTDDSSPLGKLFDVVTTLRDAKVPWATAKDVLDKIRVIMEISGDRWNNWAESSD